MPHNSFSSLVFTTILREQSFPIETWHINCFSQRVDKQTLLGYKFNIITEDFNFTETSSDSRESAVAYEQTILDIFCDHGDN